MDNYAAKQAVRASVAQAESRETPGSFSEPDTTFPDARSGYSYRAADDPRPVTAAEVDAIVRAAVSETISQIRIYVLESDITAAQNAVRAVVEQSEF